MALSFSRQVPVFVLALLVAVYQVNKARQVATQWETDGEAQLRKLKIHIAQALPEQKLRFIDENPRPGKPLSRTIIIATTHADQPPTVIGEMYVDPAIKRDLQLQRQRSRYASRSANPNNRAKARSGSLPLLAVIVDDEVLLEAVQAMQKRSIVSRVVKGKALTMKEASRSAATEDQDDNRRMPNHTVNGHDYKGGQSQGQSQAGNPPESTSNSISQPSREECATSLLDTEASCGPNDAR